MSKKKRHVVKLVFVASSTTEMKFLDVYEKIQTDKYLLDRLIECRTLHNSVHVKNSLIDSRCEIIFNDLDEQGYRDLWNLLGKNVTSYASINECNLNLTLF